MAGYMHPEYTQSLAEFGAPRLLPRCGGWVLERQIPGSPYRDAMGAYPLFACQDWSQLEADLEVVGKEWISLILVSDPFGAYTPADLEQVFKDVLIPFKEHFVVDMHLPLNEIGGSRRRKHARRALRNVQIEVCQEPGQFVDTWLDLYSNLIEKHYIQGIRAFSRTAFTKQLSMPGISVLRAVYEGETIGAQLYLMQGDVVHCHLGAVNDIGYEVGATYALDWYSFEYFADKARWLNLGGGAGLSSNGTDGLSEYKRGWATDTRTAYLCGRIFNHTIYAELAKAKNISNQDYFPTYRKGEFA